MKNSNLSWHAIAFLFWGGMDAFYICFHVLRSMERGAIPFWTDFEDALSNMQTWGGGLELVVWLGLVLQLSLIATCALFFMRCRLAVYLAMVQIPFRIFFIVPSISTILLLPMLASSISNWVWIGLMLTSEAAKGWCLLWLWRKRGHRCRALALFPDFERLPQHRKK